MTKVTKIVVGFFLYEKKFLNFSALQILGTFNFSYL
jgi:hypothetical protein